MQNLLEEGWCILRVETNIKLRSFPESKDSNQYGQHGCQTPYVILGSRIGFHKIKRVQWPNHPSSTVGSIVVLVAGEEVQRDCEHSTNLSWIWTGTKRLLYEADHRGNQQTTLLKELKVCGNSVTKKWNRWQRKNFLSYLINKREECTDHLHIIMSQTYLLLCLPQSCVHIICVTGVSLPTRETHLTSTGPQLLTHQMLI